MEFHPDMEEAEFIQAVDAGFIYNTDREYEEVTRLGCSISDNAALMVGYELASGGSHAGLDTNLRLLEIMERERPTPVIRAAVPVVRSLLKQEEVAKEATLRLLDACKEHSSAWNGLGIVLSADPGLERECERIMDGWRGEQPGGRVS